MMKSGAAGFGIKLSGAFIALLSNIAIATYLGADEAGFYFYLISIASISISISSLGGQHIILKEAPVFLSKGKLFAASSFSMECLVRTLIVSSFIVFCIIIFTALLPKSIWPMLSSNPALLPISISIITISLNNILSHIVQVCGRPLMSIAFSGPIHSFLTILLIFLLSPSASGEVGWIYLGANAAVLAIQVTICYDDLFRNGFRIQNLMPKMSQINIFASQSILEFILQAPILIVGAISGNSAHVTGYAVCYRIASTLSFSYSIATRLITPQFSLRVSEGNWRGLMHDFKRLTVISSLLIAPLVVGLIIGSEYVLSLFGDEFPVFKFTLLVLVLFQLTNISTGPAGTILIVMGRENTLFKYALAGLTLSCGLAYILSELGSEGAAIAVFVGYGIVNFGCLISALHVIKKNRGSKK